MPERIKGLRDYSFNLTANIPQYLDVTGDFFGVVTATGLIELVFDDSQKISRYQNMGGQVPEYERFQVTSPVNQVVIISLGYGSMYDNRTNLTATLSATITSPNTIGVLADVTIPTLTRTKVVTGASSLKKIHLYADSANAGNIRYGNGSTDATNGAQLQPDTGVEIDCRADLYVYNPQATDIKVSITTFSEI